MVLTPRFKSGLADCIRVSRSVAPKQFAIIEDKWSVETVVIGQQAGDDNYSSPSQGLPA